MRTLREVPRNNLPPEVDATLKLGNNLPCLGLQVNIHPFFRDMWINVHAIGSWDVRLLDAIGAAVGGKVVARKGTPTAYFLEPEVEEIRRKALDTIDYFSLTTLKTPESIRQRIRYNLLKDSSQEFIRHWIDATVKPEAVQITSESLNADIRSYKDLFFTSLRESSPDLPFLKKYSNEEIQAMPLLIDLCGYLELDIRLIGPDGVPIHI